MMREGVAVASVLVAVVFAGAVAAAFVTHTRTGPAETVAPMAIRSGPRVRVEVLNATTTRGLARRAMLHLRDRGFDVVQVGNASGARDSTVVLDRSGHPEWARRVAASLGGARVEARPDSSRYLDITVMLGRSWRAPAQPFYP